MPSGFTKQVSMPRERWMGYIKDYDGGTLMECAMNRKLNYLKLPGFYLYSNIFILAYQWA